MTGRYCRFWLFSDLAVVNPVVALVSDLDAVRPGHVRGRRIPVVPLVLFTHQCCDRKVMVCVNGVARGAISWLMFTTRTRSRVGFGSSSFAAPTGSTSCRTPLRAAAGWSAEGPPARLHALRAELAMAVRLRRGGRRAGEPLNDAVPVQLRQTGCSSHENENLLRLLACHVMRGV